MTTLDNFFIGIKSFDEPNKIITEEFNDSITGYGKLYTNLYLYNGYIKNGKLDGDGLLIYYNDSTYKSYEGTFLNNEFNGFGKLKYLDGNMYVGYFLNNKKHGSGKIYNLNGDIIIDEIWNNNIIIGKKSFINKYHNSDNIKISGTYHNSIKIGPWIYYREDKSVEYIEYYSLNTDVEILESKLYVNENGYIEQQKLNIYSSIDYTKLINEDYKYIYEQFNIKNIDYYKTYSIPLNKQNNELYLYLINNYKKSITTYNNNKEHDIIIYQSNKIIYYKYDINMINYTAYLYSYPEKELYYHGEINNNYDAHGDGFYYQNNIIKYIGKFEKGMIIKGILNNNDCMYYEGTFKYNSPDGEGKYYYPNGNISYEGMITNNKKNGVGISYWENGNINWNGSWLNNLKHGNGKLYDDTGNLICICNYEHDLISDIQ